ncbi:beta-ketoacyl synthase N-terminal-like domain-containing protein [Paenibacillus sp. sgz500958]|uniref:type I polyketide synthase n=1 Tax=Paenibacillus sp. sgz500958 TaxID=3242475 RepID=UPI0036D27CEC
MRIADENELRDLDIAIVGMDCKVPGADDVTQYWNNLCNGVESLTFFTDEELLAAGIPQELMNHPEYIKRGFKLNDIEQFDASFFGFTPREAALMDPQQRLLLESSWRLVESAGYNPDQYGGRIGVFVGTGTSKYLLKNIMSSIDLDTSPEIRQIWMGNDVHFASTMISYKLNLKGPSVNVQTACSTSLTAVTLGVQALLNYQCDMAIAGGCTVAVPQDAGYLYLQGEVLSKDGHCRPFDKDGTGTLGGSGVGLVLLKRLEDAVNDRDHIVAVIKGASFNNDGSAKVGYSAPSVEGERNAIKSAQILSEIEEETITYIEAHGTATPMGDPIEVQALTEAFQEATDKKNFCALGAVKANIGHLDAAAGTAGLIKTSLMLQNKKLVPSINYTETNPNIDLKNSPFYVNTRYTDWEPDCQVRRAGVSSFGIGGTNVHVVLEEAIETRSVQSNQEYQLLLLSAKSKNAYDKVATQLLDYLNSHEEADYRNVLYTMNVGRKRFPHRGGLVCNSREDLIEKLSSGLSGTWSPGENEREIVFLFPGQGVQYLNMIRQLYESKPVFRREMDKCFGILQEQFGYDLQEIVFSDDVEAEAEERLTETQHTQIAIFVVEYCLAKQLIDWGITPKAMLGHSIGEYVAACLAEVFSLEDALKLVLMRGRIIQSLPKGDMLYVNMNEQEAKHYLSDKVSLALINSENRVVLSGDSEALQEVMEQIQGNRDCRILHTSHAFHSYMMQAAVPGMLDVLSSIQFSAPKIPIMSNVTGEWLKPEEAADADYWVRHMLGTVRFKDAAVNLAKSNYKHFIEVGPGRTLSVFMQENLRNDEDCVLYQTLRDVKNSVNDSKFLGEFLKKAWISGLNIDFAKLYEHEVLFRIPLPTYPFEKKRHWIAPDKKMAFEEVLGSERDQVIQEADLSSDSDEEYNRPDLSVTYEAPTNVIEESVVQMLQDMMGIKPIGINDNFFELGGHSLMITQVILRIKELYDIELQLKQFVEAPTVKEVADLIVEELSANLDLNILI